MTRMNPLRRLAATTAILGLTAFGGVALAAPAMASPAAPATAAARPVPSIGTIGLPKLDQMSLGDLLGSLHGAAAMAIQSPVPDGPVDIHVGPLTLTFQPDPAQSVQSVVANFYARLNYQVAFNSKGLLVIGQKICDPTRSETFNKGCINPATDGRF